MFKFLQRKALKAIFRLQRFLAIVPLARRLSRPPATLAAVEEP